MSKILDIITCNKLHINVLGDVPKQYSNEATHNSKCFIGGSYALYVASHLLGLYWSDLQYNDIDVYIADEKHSINGGKYQNIVIPSEHKLLADINLRSASLIIHMYDLDCCKFFIYNGMVFTTDEGVQALETRTFTVRKEFMGSVDTVARVDKYRERGFNIITSIPDKILCISYYGNKEQYSDNTISYPRSFDDTLRYIFGIDPYKNDTYISLYEPFSWLSNKDLLEHDELASKVARLINKNSKYRLSIDDVLNSKWKKVEGLPTVQFDTFELTDIHVTDNLIVLEFTIGYCMVTYTIDKKNYTGYYRMNIVRPRDKPGKIVYWQTKLPYLGIAVEENGIYLRE